jgi:hypothetical protein
VDGIGRDAVGAAENRAGAVVGPTGERLMQTRGERRPRWLVASCGLCPEPFRVRSGSAMIPDWLTSRRSGAAVTTNWDRLIPAHTQLSRNRVLT